MKQQIGKVTREKSISIFLATKKGKNRKLREENDSVFKF